MTLNGVRLNPKPFARRRPVIAVALSLLLGATSPALAVRIATYNAMNYLGPPNVCDQARHSALRQVTRALNADILCVQELSGNAQATGFNSYLNNVLNHTDGPRGYVGAPYIDGQGGGGDNALYYRPDYLEVLGSWTVPTAPTGIRDWIVHRMKIRGHTSTAAEFYVFVCHLAAGDASETRGYEAQVYRNYAETRLPAGANVLVVGDMNLSGDFEPAWGHFTQDSGANIGRLYDPLNPQMTLGMIWANTCSLASIHTQSPQTATSTPANGCGYIDGGVDDRFDFLLISSPLRDGNHLDLLPGSYRAFGNDGLHCNKAIIEPPTIAEGGTIASALWNAADHLPVVMDLLEPALLGAPPVVDFGVVPVGATARALLPVRNAAREPGQFLAYILDYPPGFSGATNEFLLFAGEPALNHTITMDTSAPGVKDATLIIQNTAPDTPTYTVLLRGTVAAGIPGDMNDSGSVDSADIPLFAQVLLDPSGSVPSSRTAADLDSDGLNNGTDIPQFLSALLN